MYPGKIGCLARTVLSKISSSLIISNLIVHYSFGIYVEVLLVQSFPNDPSTIICELLKLSVVLTKDESALIQQKDPWPRGITKLKCHYLLQCRCLHLLHSASFHSHIQVFGLASKTKFKRGKGGAVVEWSKVLLLRQNINKKTCFALPCLGNLKK